MLTLDDAEISEALRRRRANHIRHGERLARLHASLCTRASEDYRVSMMRECPQPLAKKLIKTAERRCTRASTIRDLERALWFAARDCTSTSLRDSVPSVAH